MSHPRLRDAQTSLDSLTGYVRGIADALGLRDHTFDVRVGMLDGDMRATCVSIYGRRYHVLTVHDSFFGLPPEEQREAIVHEVLHPHFHPLTEHLTPLQEELGRGQYRVLERGFLRDLEQSVDALTTALVGLLPLP